MPKGQRPSGGVSQAATVTNSDISIPRSDAIPVTAPSPRRPNATGGREVVIIFATQTGRCASGLLLQSLLAYLLLPEGRGAYAVCISFASLLGVGVTFGADRGAQYFMMARQISVSQGMFLALGVCLAGSAVAVAAVFPLIHSDLAFFQKVDPGSLQLTLVLIPLISISTATELQLAGLRRFVPHAVFSLARSGITALGSVVLVWRLHMGVDGALLAVVAGHVVLFAGCIWDLRKHCGLAFEMPSLAELLRILGYGLRYYGAHVGATLQPHVSVFLLGMLTGRANIGLFAAVSALMLNLTMISNSVGIALYPRIASDAGKRPEIIELCLRLVCLATGSALVVLLAISTPLVRTLLSDAFVPVVPLMWIIAPGILASASNGLFATYFNGVDCPEVSSWAAWLGLSAHVVLLPALYPTLGLEGAAWAMTIGMIFRTVFLCFLFQRATGITPRSIWLPRRGDFVFLWTAVSHALSRRPTET